MKCIIVAALALVCAFGLVAGYGYGFPAQPAGGLGGGLGNGGLLMLIGLLFVLMTLFNTNNNTPAVTIVNATG